jgi:acetyl esterase/lipase
MNGQGYAAALLLVGFLGAFLPTAAGEAPAGPETVICKAVGDTKTEADAYGADDKVRPAVVWIHGGALILGSRKGVPGQLLERLK